MSERSYLAGIDALAGATVIGYAAEEAIVDQPAEPVYAFPEAAKPDHELPRPEPKFILKSELPNVPDAAWTKFAHAMQTAAVGAVSKSNALGMFELTPRRLADLGLVTNIEKTRGAADASGKSRMVWVGEFVPPMTSRKFLSNPVAQYRAFSRSMKDYVEGMRAGSVPVPDGGRPRDMTLSGALAVLHRCGPSGIKTWNDAGDRFEQTEQLYGKVNGIF